MPRRSYSRNLVLLALAAVFSFSFGIAPTDAQSSASAQRGPSGLPLPRFVSLKAERVNLRIGPGRDYAVEWMFLRKGLPLEIIQEYDNWRRVRDSDGTEGWVYQSLLSGGRTGMAVPWYRGKDITIEMFSEPRSRAAAIAVLEPGAIGEILVCNGEWCRMNFNGTRGWVEQSLVWGAYPGESIK